MNILLLVVGIIFLLSVLIGYKRGFLKIVVSLVSTLLCVVLVMFISPSVSKWIQESTPLRETIQNKCVEWIVLDGESAENLLQLDLSRENEITLIESADLPEVLQNMLLENNNSEAYAALGAETFGEYIGAYVAKVIADVVAFLVTFIAVFIIIRVVLGMLKIVDKIPLVGGTNRLLGGAIGAGMGVFIIWILFIVITLLYNTPLGVACLEDIAESEILTKLYDSNILMNYITKF